MAGLLNCQSCNVGVRHLVTCSMKILCLKHVPFEGPGAIALWAQQRGHSLAIHSVFDSEPLPLAESFDLLLVMGGPMNIYEYEAYPWLVGEKQFIRAAIDAGKRVVGICLGAQLIADTLGGKVTAGPQKEIGWFPIELEQPAPQSLRVCHWHGDTFALPEGAVHIARSEVCENQGFIYDERVLGLQCHLETTRESLALLIAACSDELVDGPTIQDAETMLAEPPETYEAMYTVLFELLDRLK